MAKKCGDIFRGVLRDNFAWTTPKGQFVKSREDIKLPSSHWQWVGDMSTDAAVAVADVNCDGGCGGGCGCIDHGDVV